MVPMNIVPHPKIKNKTAHLFEGNFYVVKKTMPKQEGEEVPALYLQCTKTMCRATINYKCKTGYSYGTKNTEHTHLEETEESDESGDTSGQAGDLLDSASGNELVESSVQPNEGTVVVTTRPSDSRARGVEKYTGTSQEESTKKPAARTTHGMDLPRIIVTEAEGDDPEVAVRPPHDRQQRARSTSPMVINNNMHFHGPLNVHIHHHHRSSSDGELERTPMPPESEAKLDKANQNPAKYHQEPYPTNILGFKKLQDMHDEMEVLWLTKKVEEAAQERGFNSPILPEEIQEIELMDGASHSGFTVFVLPTVQLAIHVKISLIGIEFQSREVQIIYLEKN